MKKIHALLIFSFILLINLAQAQEKDSIGLYDLSIEELMNIKIKVSSLDFSENIREAPGVFSVITKEDIYYNQCRNLVDVFNMIPGLSTGKDIMDFFGLFSRGMYGLEGRALVMLNGMALNEMYWGIFSYGGGFPVNLIDRIEVIRGPGSVIYGGNAELCVINIISHDMSNDNKGEVYVSSGFLKSNFGHNDIGVNISSRKDKLLIGALLYGEKSLVAEGPINTLSDEPKYYYTSRDAYGRIGGLASLNLNYDNKYYIHTNSHIQEMNYASPALRKSSKYEYNVFSSEVGAKFDLSENIEAHISNLYKNSLWSPFRHYPIIVHRIKPSMKFNYSDENLSVLVGTEFVQDLAFPKSKRINTTSNISLLDTVIDSKPFIRGYNQEYTNSSSLWTAAIFSSLKYKISDFNIIIGGRFDKNEFYGQKVSPRLALTYVKNKFNAKAIYSQAFRAPNIANAFGVGSIYNYTNPSLTKSEVETIIEQNEIKRENTEVYELQVGYLLGDFYLTGNVFKQRTFDIIEFNPAFDYLSVNGGEFGSSGFEAEISYTIERLNSKANFSFVKPNKTEGQTYVVPISVTWDPDKDLFDGEHLLGVSNIKIFTSHTYNFYKNLSINLHALYFSEKYFVIYTENNSQSNQKLNPQIIFGSSILLENLFNHSFDLSFSVEDITDQRMNIVSAFNAYGYSSDFLPYKGREICFSMRYRF